MSHSPDSDLSHTSSNKAAVWITRPANDLDQTQAGSLSSILSVLTEGLSTLSVTTDSPSSDSSSGLSSSPLLLHTLAPQDDNATTATNMSIPRSGSASIESVTEWLVSDNVTQYMDAKSTYFTNMMTWFIATGAVVAAVILLAFINCCIENRYAIKKMLGLGKSKHIHMPGEEKRVRRDLKNAFEKSDDHDYQVHLIWSRFAARSSTRKEQSHI